MFGTEEGGSKRQERRTRGEAARLSFYLVLPFSYFTRGKSWLSKFSKYAVLILAVAQQLVVDVYALDLAVPYPVLKGVFFSVAKF